jgi:hypothetical protein
MVRRNAPSEQMEKLRCRKVQGFVHDTAAKQITDKRPLKLPPPPVLQRKKGPNGECPHFANEEVKKQSWVFSKPLSEK